MGVAFTRPEAGPRTALQFAEVVNFHDALAAVAHELKATVEVENLDAITTTREHAAQQIVIPH